MKRKLLTVVAMALIYCLVLTGCPSRTQIEKSAAASNQLSVLTGKTVDGVALAFQRGAVNLETKDKLVPILRDLNTGGAVFNEAVKNALESFKTDRTVPDWQRLNMIFNDSVITHFSTLLMNLKFINADQATILLIAVAALRSTILIISNSLGTGARNEQSFQKIEKEWKIGYG